MALDGLIADLDGTLVDTNALHVEAWVRGLKAHGYEVAPDRIFVEVGKGGDRLVPGLLGQRAEQRDGESLRGAQKDQFVRLARERGIKPFPRAAELLDALRQRGLRVAVATSSGADHLEPIQRAAELALSDHVDEIVTADDIDHTKPAPDLVTSAAHQLGLIPAQCAMLGDTPWDALASRNAGAICLGLTCGGNDANVLRESGARGVWQDPADLLDHLDAALCLCSPGPLHLTQDVLRDLMRQALDVAQEGTGHGEAPIGAVVARGDGTVIGRGWNRLSSSRNKTAHAEMVAFADAAGRADVTARDLLLISTLEPCVMCTGAAMEAAVDTIVFGLRAPADAGTARVKPPLSPESQMPRIVGDVLAHESLALFKQWLPRNEHKPQADYVRQLLSLHHTRT